MKSRRAFLLMGSVCMVVGLVLMPFVAGAQKKPVVIGGVTHLTGSVAHYGTSVKLGADLAIEQYNAKGGILGGRQIVIKWEDDKSNPTEAVSALRKLHAEGMRLFTGWVLSGNVLAVLPAAKQLGCLIVNPSSAHPKAAGDGTAFSMQSAAPVMQWAHLKIVMQKWNPKTVYLVHVNDEYGRSVYNAAKSFFTEHGVKIVGEAFPEREEVEFRTLLTKIKQINPDIWFLNHNGNAARLALWEQSIEVGVRDKMVMASEMLSDAVAMARPEVSNGIWSTSFWFAKLSNPVNNKFVSDFTKRYNVKEHEISDMSAVGWQAVVVLLEAVKKVGNETDIEAIRKALWATDIEGLWGRLRFDPQYGRPFYTPYEYVIKDKTQFPVLK